MIEHYVNIRQEEIKQNVSVAYLLFRHNAIDLLAMALQKGVDIDRQVKEYEGNTILYCYCQQGD